MTDSATINGNTANQDTLSTSEPSPVIISRFQLSPAAMEAKKKQLNEFLLTPDELMSRRKLLSVREAAYVLNVCPRQIRNMVSDGKLPRAADAPLRIPTEAVKQLLDDCDVWESPDDKRLDQKALELGLDR